MRVVVLATVVSLAVFPPAFAQEQGPIDLPAICTAGAGTDHGMGMEMETEPGTGMAPAGDEAHQALMASMGQMNAEMMAGGTAEDIDVAFVCAMIPHHRGAISMARAQLEHGDDEWARQLAQRVIDAQEKEIAEMLAWLEQQAQ
jgi:uncharacterized protein (DUF305 family)